tara:strand:- start:3198 stop:3557 length:360 start_codon:yes stop_codon:yes gene_type:complete
MIPDCVPECPYKNLLESAEQKLQEAKRNELHKCKEQNKAKERKLRDLNKKVITLTVIATVAGTLIGKEALEFIGEWLGMLEGLNIGGGGGSNTVTGPFPAPGTLGVFAVAALFPAKRRK